MKRQNGKYIAIWVDTIPIGVDVTQNNTNIWRAILVFVILEIHLSKKGQCSIF